MSDPAALVLARFAAGLRHQDLPATVRRAARACIIDTVGVMLAGARLPWSQSIAAYARRYGAHGACTLIGAPATRVTAPAAALAHGAFAHAFEQDSLRRPGAGVHPGATLLPPALAAAEETGASGQALLTAFVAATEVMFRIGAASKHSSEALGFHAPGLTGPYGAAIVSGLLRGLSVEQLANAIGIAGSLSGGLLAFTKAPQGAMVKRLHLGRAAESGVLAAQLAADGFDGPHTVLEGRYGFLQAYCKESDPARLTAGLGETWETLRICLKAYPSHVTAHTPITALRDLMARHGFDGDAIATLHLTVSDKVLSHHDIRAPNDIMQGQYSVPFCVALAAWREPADPRSWDGAALADPRIGALCRDLTLSAFPADQAPESAWQSRLAVTLKDGRQFTAEGKTFRGMPEDPPSDAEQARKFLLLAAGAESAASGSAAQALLDQLGALEVAPDCHWFRAAADL